MEVTMGSPKRMLWSLVLTVCLTTGAAAATPRAPTPSASPSAAASDVIEVRVEARADDPCPLEVEPACTAQVSISPVGVGEPVVEGTLDPAADPATALTAYLAPGSYAVSVTALGLPEDTVLSDPPGQEPYPTGGCGTTLELVPEQVMVRVTALMAWYQAACGITIEPQAAMTGPPALADPVRATGQPPRFRPRGAPEASATGNGIQLDLWVRDTTLRQGQWLLAHLRVTNVGRKAIRYEGIIEDLRCPPLRFSADTSGLFDPGRTWTGIAGEFKRRFMDQGLLQRTPLTIPERARGRTCTVGRVSRLAPGAVVEVPLAAMPAYELRAQPLPSGVISVSAAFEGRRFGDSDRVVVTTDVTLAGDPVTYPSPGQLADAALSTPGFIEALEMAPNTDAWMNAWAAWWPRRPYPPQPRMAGTASAPRGVLEIGQFVGSDLDRPFVVGAVIDPWTGESLGSSWF
jgi:hypothetical protein